MTPPGRALPVALLLALVDDAGTVLDVADSSFAELAPGTRALMVAP